MSGRKVSEARLLQEARKALEDACRACRRLADQASRIARDAGNAKALVAQNLTQAQQYVSQALEGWSTAVAAYDSLRCAIEQDMQAMLRLGRASEDRILAAQEAEQLRAVVEGRVQDLDQRAAKLRAIADRIQADLPKVMDKRVLQWSEDQRMLQGLLDELGRRQERGELDSRLQDAGSLLQAIREAVASPDSLPPDTVPRLTARLEKLVDISWEDEIARQEQLETGDRLARVLADCDFKPTGRIHGDTIILTGETGDESVAARIDADGTVTWDMVCNADGKSARSCRPKLEKIVTKALAMDVALTGFHMVEGRKPVEIAAAAKAEEAKRREPPPARRNRRQAPGKPMQKPMTKELP